MSRIPALGSASATAQVLVINEADVTVNVTLLGGEFGRKSKPDRHVAEAALLSRAVTGGASGGSGEQDEMVATAGAAVFSD